MNVITSHQHGLIEQLEFEVEALAGRPTDHGQRAVVLHHLYDHSNGAFGWALTEARRGLRIAAGLARLEQRLHRWGWLAGGAERARPAFDQLTRALGEQAQSRCALAYRAYRLSATAALRSEAERELDPALLTAFDTCHAERRTPSRKAAAANLELSLQMEELMSQAAMPQLEAAWSAIGQSRLRRAARRLVGEPALARAARLDERRGCERTELELRKDPRLPAAFRANPAQHFYALQHAATQRRRQQWRDDCDREADAVALAA